MAVPSVVAIPRLQRAAALIASRSPVSFDREAAETLDGLYETALMLGKILGEYRAYFETADEDDVRLLMLNKLEAALGLEKTP